MPHPAIYKKDQGTWRRKKEGKSLVPWAKLSHQFLWMLSISYYFFLKRFHSLHLLWTMFFLKKKSHDTFNKPSCTKHTGSFIGTLLVASHYWSENSPKSVNSDYFFFKASDGVSRFSSKYCRPRELWILNPTGFNDHMYWLIKLDKGVYAAGNKGSWNKSIASSFSKVNSGISNHLPSYLHQYLFLFRGVEESHFFCNSRESKHRG